MIVALFRGMNSQDHQQIANLRLKIISFLPADLPVTRQEDERILLARLADPSDRDPVETFWQLVYVYCVVGDYDLACTLINHMLRVDESVEYKAKCYLVLGQIAEIRNRYDAAIDFYTRGLTFRTTDKRVKYLLYNNMGYCLNMRGMHRAAETYCRSAIEIDSTRANAFKNLGLSLAGQNNFLAAAWAYAEATRADACDPRALQLLEQLISDHPELAGQIALVIKDETRQVLTAN